MSLIKKLTKVTFISSLFIALMSDVICEKKEEFFTGTKILTLGYENVYYSRSPRGETLISALQHNTFIEMRTNELDSLVYVGIKPKGSYFEALGKFYPVPKNEWQKYRKDLDRYHELVNKKKRY
jgi:hypothetical protein